MGHMPPDCFSNDKNRDVKNKHYTKSGTWPWAICPHTSKKRLKPLVEAFGTKQFGRSSYTIFERPLEERHGERAKVKTNVSWSKVTFVLGCKSWTKGGKSTSIGGWKRWRILVVSLDGVASVFGANVCIAQTYSPTWTKACAQHNHANGGGVGSKNDSNNLQEIVVSALIVCSSYNASQLPPMY